MHTSQYMETYVDVPFNGDYDSLNRRIIGVVDGNRGLSYAIMGCSVDSEYEAGFRIAIRGNMGSDFPTGSKTYVRTLVKGMPMDMCISLSGKADIAQRIGRIMHDNGFAARSVCTYPDKLSFYAKNLGQKLVIPFVYASMSLEVVDHKKAVDAMLNGIGLHREYGLGTLVEKEWSELPPKFTTEKHRSSFSTYN